MGSEPTCGRFRDHAGLPEIRFNVWCRWIWLLDMHTTLMIGIYRLKAMERSSSFFRSFHSAYDKPAGQGKV